MHAGAAALLLGLPAIGPAAAAMGDCGQPVSNGSKPTATDARAVLRAAVGALSCPLWTCDVDNSGSVSVADALRVLRLAVGQSVTLNCPPFVSTTTTTLPPPVDLACEISDGEVTFDSGGSESSSALQGELTLRCADPASGGGNCECLLEEVEPIPFQGLGVVCATPAAGCASGSLDCDGGAPRRSSVQSDHAIGTCNSNNACASACEVHCDGLGMDRLGSACEGFCAGGPNKDQACTSSNQCSGSSCNGFVQFHGPDCACHCVGQQGPAAAAALLTCQLGLSLTLESEAPCGDGDEFLNLGEHCMALTSAALEMSIAHSNDSDAEISTAPDDGVSRTCSQLDAGGASGLTLVGGAPLIDTLLGDLLVTMRASCD